MCNKEWINAELTTFLDTLPLPILNESETLLCEGALNKKELHAARMSMAKEKAPGNHRLTREFFSCFLEELSTFLKELFVTSIIARKRKIEFTSSQNKSLSN